MEGALDKGVENDLFALWEGYHREKNLLRSLEVKRKALPQGASQFLHAEKRAFCPQVLKGSSGT